MQKTGVRLESPKCTLKASSVLVAPPGGPTHFQLHSQPTTSCQKTPPSNHAKTRAMTFPGPRNVARTSAGLLCAQNEHSLLSVFTPCPQRPHHKSGHQRSPRGVGGAYFLTHPHREWPLDYSHTASTTSWCNQFHMYGFLIQHPPQITYGHVVSLTLNHTITVLP